MRQHIIVQEWQKRAEHVHEGPSETIFRDALSMETKGWKVGILILICTIWLFGIFYLIYTIVQWFRVSKIFF